MVGIWIICLTTLVHFMGVEVQVKVLDQRFEVKTFVWLCKRIGACCFLRMASGLLELLSRLNAAYEKISTIQLGADKSLLIIIRMTFLLFCDCRDGSEDGLTFAFRFTDATISIPNQGNFDNYFALNVLGLP